MSFSAFFAISTSSSLFLQNVKVWYAGMTRYIGAFDNIHNAVVASTLARNCRDSFKDDNLLPQQIKKNVYLMRAATDSLVNYDCDANSTPHLFRSGILSVLNTGGFTSFITIDTYMRQNIPAYHHGMFKLELNKMVEDGIVENNASSYRIAKKHTNPNHHTNTVSSMATIQQHRKYPNLAPPANLIQHHMNIGLFRPEEDNAIIKGVQELGDNPGRWADIKCMFPIELAQKSRSQIRSRWRVMKQKLSITTQASALATTQFSASVPALAQVPIQQQSPANLINTI
jgi:hypothetical protein